jgi:acyl CoA:acetate/3-ketoacid CoA transferase alpha subunit
MMALGDAVAAMVRSGDTVSVEGFGQRIPLAAVHEIVRQRIGDLHLHVERGLVTDRGVWHARAGEPRLAPEVS